MGAPRSRRLGKTRTVIALCDLLMRCNWAKRALFLVDRVALVNQAVNAFKKHLPGSSPVNLVTELEEKAAIPMVRDQLRLIQEVQTDAWWRDVTIPMLEVLRRRLRGLVHLIEKQRRKPIYTDFEDLIRRSGSRPGRLRPWWDGRRRGGTDC